MLNNAYSCPLAQSNTGSFTEQELIKYNHHFSHKLKSSDNIFDLSALQNLYADYDQQDDYNLHNNKIHLLRVLLIGQNKILAIRKKEFISIQSSSYFELDIPPPLLDI